jgi:hypothetical protein
MQLPVPGESCGNDDCKPVCSPAPQTLIRSGFFVHSSRRYKHAALFSYGSEYLLVAAIAMIAGKGKADENIQAD